MDTVREHRLAEILCELFALPDLCLDDRLTPKDVPGWDSFNHVNLLVQVEEAFGLRFTSDEAAAIRTVGDLKAAIEAKCQGPAHP